MQKIQKLISVLNQHQTIAMEAFNTDVVQVRFLDLSKAKLYNKGETSDKTKLKTDRASVAYSPFTERLKREKGQITSHVTLKDTGEFYKSFNILALPGGLKLSAEFKKQGAKQNQRAKSVYKKSETSYIFDNFTSQFPDENLFMSQVLNIQSEQGNKLTEVFNPVFVRIFKSKL